MKIFNKISILTFLLSFLFFTSLSFVSTGSIKVITQLGRVTGRVLHPGLNFKLPLIESTITYDTKKVLYETTNEDKQRGSKADYKDFPVDTNTSDGQQVDIYYTIRFSVDPNKATWIAQNIGNEDNLVEKVVKADSRIWVRTLAREFSASDLYTGNISHVQLKIEEKLKPVFSNNGIILDEIGIREIKFNEEYVKAMEQKQIQAVNIGVEKNIAEQAIYRKQATITLAEGVAKEQELLRSTVTPELLQKKAIEKWNGVLPTYFSGSDTQMLFNIPTK